MTVVEIIDFVTLYGVDVVALAAVTAAVCAILKKTLLKDAERLNAFMPYIIGSALYAAYAAAAHGSLAFLCDNMCEVISRGFAVGALATMAKAAVSKKACGAAAPVKAVAAMLEGYVAAGSEIAAAEEMAALFGESGKDGFAAGAAQTLSRYAAGELPEGEAAVLAELIGETLEFFYAAP